MASGRPMIISATARPAPNRDRHAVTAIAQSVIDAVDHANVRHTVEREAAATTPGERYRAVAQFRKQMVESVLELQFALHRLLIDGQIVSTSKQNASVLGEPKVIREI